MNSWAKYFFVTLFFVPMVGLFAFTAFSATEEQNPAQSLSSDGAEIAASTSPAELKGTSWETASPEVLAGIESMDGRMQTQSYLYESLLAARSNEVSARIGFDKASPAEALELAVNALDRMASSWKDMRPEARKDVARLGTLSRIDALLAYEPAKGDEDPSTAELSARYEASVERAEKRDIDEFQDRLAARLLALRLLKSGFPFRAPPPEQRQR